MRLRSDAGFTLIEVLVACTVLLVGAIGAAQMGSVANRSTNAASLRNGATAVARRLVEAARGSDTRDLTSATLMATLRSAAPDVVDSDTGDTAWTVLRRGFTYTLSASVCTLDDPSDGIGTHDSTYCANPTATNPPDSQPADAKQVTVLVSYAKPLNGVVRQVTEVPIGANTALPVVSKLTLTSQTSTAANFSVTAANNPATMTWLVGGNPMATCPPTTTCSGSGSSWAFTWNLGTPTKDLILGDANYGQCLATNTYVYDGTYDVAARVQDSYGLTAGPASLPFKLDRCAPTAPPNFNATQRDTTAPVPSIVDMEWEDNPEGDVLGYRVYEGTATTSRTPVCPASVSSGQYIALGAAKTCIDTSPPAYSSKNAYYYAVYAIDRDSAGALREGALSYVNVNSTNRPPKVPTTLTGVASGGNVTLTWKLPSTPYDPDTGDTIDSFRIYRRANSTSPTYVDRVDRNTLAQMCGTSTTCTWTDTATGGTVHYYWVTAVDTHLRESSLLGPKSA